MTSDAELRDRETVRRKALWALVDIALGDQKALPVLDVLDDIERRERFDSVSIEAPSSIEDVRRFVPVEAHPIGCNIIRESNIPQPWRERFLAASVGSTRVAEGPYSHDWGKFLAEWQNEMQLLETHRMARGEKQ
ncbi:hypothetical protein [Pseudomonas mohnii]